MEKFQRVVRHSANEDGSIHSYCSQCFATIQLLAEAECNGELANRSDPESRKEPKKPESQLA